MGAALIKLLELQRAHEISVQSLLNLQKHPAEGIDPLLEGMAEWEKQNISPGTNIA